MNSRLAIVAASALVLAACAAPADEAGSSTPAPTASSTPAPGDVLEWENAVVGTCLEDWTGYDSEVMIEDCDYRHDGQIVGVGTLPSAGGPYPGRDVAEREAFELCAAAFDEFVGGPSDELVLSWTGADEENWTSHSGEVLCEIGSASDEPLLGSAEGSGAPGGPGSVDNLILLLSEGFSGLPDQPATQSSDGLSEQVLDGQLLLTPGQPNMSYQWGQDLPSVGAAEVTAVGGPAGESTGAGVWGVALSEQLSTGSVSGVMLLCGTDGQATLWDTRTMTELMQVPEARCGPDTAMNLRLDTDIPGPSFIAVSVGGSPVTAYAGDVDYGPVVAATLVVETLDQPGFTAAVSHWSAAAR
jgi:hypothetical protein